MDHTDPKRLKKLEERAKELKCVYSVDEVLQDRGLALSAALQKLTHVLPAGFADPNACRIQITLREDTYETPGFSDAKILHREPILLGEDPVGTLTVGYIPALLQAECRILKHEEKMLHTISQRISQTALARQGDFSLLLNILRQIDPDMLLRIGEKLRIHLQHTVGSTAETAFEPLSGQKQQTYGEVNSPLAPGDSFHTEGYAQKLIDTASTFLSPETILGLMNEWISEERIFAFVKTVDQKDASISDILDAVRKYTSFAPNIRQADSQYSKTETWLISELTHRFLSDDEHLINLVLDNLKISDFEPMISHTISSEHSTGNIGGKGAGLFIASQILRHAAKKEPLLRDIQVPQTWYLATDQIIDFLHYNNLEELNSYKYNSAFHLRMTYDNVVKKIKSANLPPQTVNMLRIVLEDLSEKPLIVRSSSLLEDKSSGAFSGKYKSLFLSNQGTRQERLEALTDAILEVYSSMYNPDSIQYRKERGLLNFTEQMGVLIQEVVGQKIGHYYLPAMAGVAFSENLLRWSHRIEREDGLVRIVMGLGTRAVDRVSNDYPVLFAPGKPQLSINQSPWDVMHYAPKQIDVIDLAQGKFVTLPAADFLREEGHAFPGLYQYVSVYEQDFIKEKNRFSLDTKKDRMAITFHRILTESKLPQQLERMLKVLSEKIQTPVDIEFAHDGTQLYLLQCRPQSVGPTHEPAQIPQNIPRKDILFTANRYISDGKLSGISYIVYVDGEAYRELPSRDALLRVGEAVGAINEALPRRDYILMGPGRWGSRGDIQLGVRVTYSDISGTAALIEVAKEKHSYIPELSFGTHFFQDLVEADILYIPLYPDDPNILFGESFLRSSPNILEELLPDYADLSHVVRVIDVAAASRGRSLHIHMNARLEKAMAFFSSQPPNKGETERTQLQTLQAQWQLRDNREHWEWRYFMAQQIANSLDMPAFGIKAVYLFGSTDTGRAAMGSDIDLLLHAQTDSTAIPRLRLWLDGWSRALAKINFLQTGHDSDTLLDIHIVTDADIAAGDPYATRINSPWDPVTLLRRLEE